LFALGTQRLSDVVVGQSIKLRELNQSCVTKSHKAAEQRAQPEGLQESSRWSESAETTGKVVSHDRTPKGCQTSR